RNGLVLIHVREVPEYFTASPAARRQHFSTCRVAEEDLSDDRHVGPVAPMQAVGVVGDGALFIVLTKGDREQIRRQSNREVGGCGPSRDFECLEDILVLL